MQLFIHVLQQSCVICRRVSCLITKMKYFSWAALQLLRSTFCCLFLSLNGQRVCFWSCFVAPPCFFKVSRTWIVYSTWWKCNHQCWWALTKQFGKNALKDRIVFGSCSPNILLHLFLFLQDTFSKYEKILFLVYEFLWCGIAVILFYTVLSLNHRLNCLKSNYTNWMYSCGDYNR